MLKCEVLLFHMGVFLHKLISLDFLVCGKPSADMDGISQILSKLLELSE